jgi:putative spermidine/putrescine transport system ATP-binding protein
MPFLVLEGLTKRYGDQLAVESMDLTVEKGEFVSLLGPSGCGKTTTLQMIAGFVDPTAGGIILEGRDLLAVRPSKRGLGIVFQSYALFPHITAAENVAFGLEMRGIAKAERDRQVEEALALVGLSALADRYPRRMSGGQQQRVALARAIVTRPDILLFDEPLSNLDAKLREKVRLEIRELQKRLDITTLYVTHDQAEALAISDRIVVMNGGHIEQIGDPASIYRSPRSAFVADFLGAANIVEGRAVDGGLIDTAVGRFAVADASAAENGAVKLSWRPEDMKLAATGSANIRDATVRSVVFRGNFVELVVEVGGHPLRAQLDSDLPVAEGDTLSFAVAPNRIRVVA